MVIVMHVLRMVYGAPAIKMRTDQFNEGIVFFFGVRGLKGAQTSSLVALMKLVV